MTKLARGDIGLIDKILERGLAIAWRHPDTCRAIIEDIQGMRLDVVFMHTGCCPMDLAAWLAAPDGDFTHDFFGIYRHFDRREFVLTGCFTPRYAAKYSAAAVGA